MGLNIMCSRLSIISTKLMSNLQLLPRCRVQTNTFHSLALKVPKNRVNNSIQIRTFIFKRPTKTQLKIRDNISDDYLLIYRNTMERYLLLAQIFTTTTAIIVGLCVIYKGDLSGYKLPISSNLPQRPRETENELLVYLTAFIIVVVVLQIFLSKLPIRIYNFPQKKEYRMVFYGNFPFTYRKAAFKVGEVSKLEEKGILPWRQGRYQLKDGHKLILMDEYFRRPADLFIMLGLQKDPDVDK